jgi:predicted fused transcriptional regulator/phosphomethylpyrimidine kinase
MPKKKIEEPIEEITEVTEEVTETIEDVNEPKGDAFDVIAKDGGVARTYTVDIHGKDAEKLAHQYAGKIGGTVR